MKRTYAELMKEIEEKWTVENITTVLDEMGIEYELVEEEGEQKVSVNEMKIGEIKEYQYRLRHRVTGQFVSYLDVTSWNEPLGVPQKIGAIEFSDIEDEAEIISFNYDDGSGENTHYPLAYILSRHEECYGQYLLDMEAVVEDEKYLFYSEDLDTYFDYISIDTALNGATSFRLDSVPPVYLYDFKHSGTSDEEIIELFEQNTNFHKVKVSDLD